MIMQHKTLVSQKTRKSRVLRVVAKNSTKQIGIVGSGGVGSAIASSLIHKNIVKNIYINDMNMEMCRGVVFDLEDEAFITGTHIHHAVSLRNLKDCDVVVITAGAKQKPDEPRTELIGRNTIILKNIIQGLLPLKEDAIILLVSNPVDVLTSIVQEWCCDNSQQSIPRNRIIGSGTYLDTQRVRVAISKELDVSVKSVHAYILGEHGDSQVFAKSISRIGGAPLLNFPELSPYILQNIENEAKRKAYEIIKRKGSTSHGIGECVAAICESIILDKNEVMSVSSYHPSFETCLGWPAVVGANGVSHIMPLNVDKDDLAQVQRSASVIKQISTDMLNIYPW